LDMVDSPKSMPPLMRLGANGKAGDASHWRAADRL
jgi:hypothetical protein